ncbi:MAG TPA: lactonase family protein [Polyangiaceae bacterium]|nr:lactonase family protein [Polyangiaceae bacterium]
MSVQGYRWFTCLLVAGSLAAIGASCSEDAPGPAPTGGTAGAPDGGGGAGGQGGSGASAGTAGAPGGSAGSMGGQGGSGASGGSGGSGGQGGSVTGGNAGQGGSGGASGAGTGGNAGSGAAAGKDGGIAVDAAPRDGTADSPETSAPGTTYVYTSGYDPKITIFTLDRLSGVLTSKGSLDTGISSPSYLAFSADKRFLYAVNEATGANSKVLAFKIAPDGSLQKINEAPTGGDGSPHLSVTPDGRWVLVAHYGSGHVSTLAVDANGGVTMPPADIQRPATSTSHQILTDATGSFAFVPNVNANTVFQFKLDAATGKLTANGSVSGFPSGAGPRHLARHPTSNWAYTMNETAVTVTSLVYDPATGTFSGPQTIDSLPAGTAKTGSGAHVVVHPAGQFVYTSNRGHNSISIFEIDAATGRLTMRGNETGGGAIKTPRDFGMDPAGKFLFVANQDAASLMVFEINATDGKLTLRDTKTTPAGPSFAGALILP